MIQIAIDSSTPIASISLKDAKGEISSIEASSPNSHIETLSLLLEELLQRNNLQSSDIEQIILGAGPGSFTGLRIGYSFVSGLAVALKVPVIEISSLQAGANLLDPTKLKVVLTDARREEFFVGFYLQVEHQLIPIIPEQIMKLSLLEEVLKNKLVELDLTSNNLAIYSNHQIKLLEQVSSKDFSSLSANLLRLISANPVTKTSFSVNLIANLKPNYLRQVAAVKLKDPRRSSLDSN